MKIPIVILFTIFCFSSKAQVNEGIKFEKNLNWFQIKEKAKKENKYIFVDTYTTWCAPCKVMEKEIFPQKSIGDFFNKNFINAKVQIDRTKNDSEEIIKWYPDAKFIENMYKIDSYPTYLFFSPDGNLVHEIKGGTESAEEFIAKASAALNPKTQYDKLKKEFADGNRDTTFLKLLITTATSTNDIPKARVYMQNYLKSQTNLLTSQNIKYIAASVENSKDIGYEILLNNPIKVIPVIGDHYRNYILNTIAFDEDILPLLRINGNKEVLAGGMMVNYTGEINKNVDWDTIQLMLNAKYKDRTKMLMFEAKTTYFKWTEDWNNLNKTLIEYTKQSEPIDESIICKWLHFYVSFGKQEYFSDAIKWANTLLLINKNSSCIKNYGILLFRAGENKEAIKVLLDYKKSLKNTDETVIGDLIDKMRNGDKID